MSEDHLDNETSVSASLTETGIEAKARSRTISSLDRLCGSIIDVISAPVEGVANRRRAKTAGEVQIIEAVAEYGVEQLHLDPNFARRAVEKHYGKLFSAQENTDAVAREALEHLRIDPPTEQESREGSDELSEAFLDRLEFYARSASTDELRERWGRVLAAEIRKPGNFSAKVLRVVDELDAQTARIFEEICTHRLDDALPKVLVGELGFSVETSLTTAGLIIEPGFGQLRQFGSTTDNNGKELWFCGFDEMAVAIPATVELPRALDLDSSHAITRSEDHPAIPCYVLTDVGKAIASILPLDEADVAASLAK
ncbi:DUF2806 domain-containing protein [Hoeflea alexandrii]|uniref:DUF2806 domain-containing protein n=2 Tax=Hoeflea alexandrii TaxID=288436 RepID=A0ABT1CTB2_9HYPH|nr:DUF2806 domain-containing protein [Hoeflea alexandrii]MCO6409435.1 DUF2806 domain-containing protein [Hoeflea alexandrii]MCY0152025.1 DUF2806 domain-containing protein [Hoeflea alexandrii]